MRCMHEASLYEDNCFITLTYSDDHLPYGGSLRLEDFQCFMKRLRKKFAPRLIRFFHCGEYGEKLGRPHYHALLFNFDFADKELWSIRQGNRVYRSRILEELWPFGQSEIGSVTFQSAAYVARYITKKVTGRDAAAFYESIDPATGEVIDRRPEYVTMSRRPGIGKGWYEKFKGDVFPDDFCLVNGKKVRPPKFYERQLELQDPELFEVLKMGRVESAKEHRENNSVERLAVREDIQYRKMDRLKRSFESE